MEESTLIETGRLTLKQSVLSLVPFHFILFNLILILIIIFFITPIPGKLVEFTEEFRTVLFGRNKDSDRDVESSC